MGDDEALRHCRTCGYDIHSLASDAACPECGTHAKDSRASYLLVDADPAWLARVELGLRIIRWTVFGVGLALHGLMAVLLIMLIGSRGSLTTQPGSWFGPTSPWIHLLPLLYFRIVPVLVVVLMIGWWFMAERDPRDAQRPERHWPRIALRWLAALIVLMCAAIVARSVLPSWLVTRTAVAMMLCITLTACGLAFLAALELLRRLAERIPAPKWATSARRHGTWGRRLLPLPILALVTLIVMSIVAPGALARTRAFMGLAYIAAGVAVLSLSGTGKLFADVAKSVRVIRCNMLRRVPRSAVRCSRG